MKIVRSKILGSTPNNISPYSLLQEELWHEEDVWWRWKILVICTMLNLTRSCQVRSVMGAFFSRFPDPAEASDEDAQVEMSLILRHLGMHNRRARSIRTMSEGYLRGLPVDELHGVGRYAHDSWRIFVQREIFPDVEDKELKNYIAWARGIIGR